MRKTKPSIQLSGSHRKISLFTWLITTSMMIFLFQNCGGRDAAFTEFSKAIPLAGNQTDQPTDEQGDKSEDVEEEMVTEKMECPDNPNEDCMMICHVPPGNPDNAKTKILPLAAIEAHLHHGEEEKSDDYYGPCL